MAMSLHDFDQTDKGWRQYKENTPLMISLVADYIKVNGATDDILTWHLGQLYATNNEHEKAIQEMIKTLRPLDGTQDDLNRSWNFYVMGSISFLRNDQQALSLYRDSLRNNPVSMNSEVLQRLLSNFGKSYKNAY
jgi:tetratricopeptide (TPR) repeat protein